jgi:hypothetical protein
VVKDKTDPHGKRRIPEVWLGEKGIAYLAAYGLAALVPQDDSNAAYISREYFAKKGAV